MDNRAWMRWLAAVAVCAYIATTASAQELLSSNRLRRLPPVRAEVPNGLPSTSHLPSESDPLSSQDVHAENGVDGTWRKEGQFLIIDLNGQQIRLAEASLSTSQNPQVPPSSGEVHGRLSHFGQPLVNCEVALVRLNKAWNGYTPRGSSDSLRTTTDHEGIYHFTGIPSGPYQLKWRPAGEASWIHRAETRPDVRVRVNEISNVKEIRVALRTIN